jgi:hypothetical protein
MGGFAFQPRFWARDCALSAATPGKAIGYAFASAFGGETFPNELALLAENFPPETLPYTPPPAAEVPARTGERMGLRPNK